MSNLFLQPNWPAPYNVHALVTLRSGGISLSPFDSWNLAEHVGDKKKNVAENRTLLRSFLPSDPKWLTQVHGSSVVECFNNTTINGIADAAFTKEKNVVCVVMTADCLPVFFCNQNGTRVAVAHAGWRGLCSGILENTWHKMCVTGAETLVWFGPAISSLVFEVGSEVRANFLKNDMNLSFAFLPGNKNDKWFLDLYAIAKYKLINLGITKIYGGEYCTCRQKEYFFSYRRDGKTGRMANLIWLDKKSDE